MGPSRFLIFSIILSFAFLGIRADSSIEDDAVVATEAADSSIRLELEQLRSKIAVLETSIADRTQKLKIKDDRIKQMEHAIKEKLEIIASLQSQLESLQLQKINDEHKRRLKKTEHALQVAEQELMKAQLEAASKKKELNEIFTPLQDKAEERNRKGQEEDVDEGVLETIKSLFDPNEKTKSGKLLPKAYLKSAREVVKTLRESLEEDGKDVAKFRRTADSAKESIREYLSGWRGQQAVVSEAKGHLHR